MPGMQERRSSGENLDTGVIGRRAFLGAPLALWAQARRAFALPDVLVVWTNQRTLPDALRRECLVFPRAYAAAPRPELARRALETGIFPHAIQPGDFQLPFRQLTARSIDDLVKMSLGTAPGTITIVTSAGGDGEDSPFERSVHVPLAIRYAGMLIARNAPEILISHVDIVPTLFGLAALTLPQPVQGRNLAPLLMRREGGVPDAVYLEGNLRQPGEWRAIIRGYDKLVLRANGEVTALYNVAGDPDEKIDLAKLPAHRLTRDGMQALARVWMRRLNDGFDSTGVRVR